MAEGLTPATIEELLTCSLCLELFREPKTLTCLHSFCKECLNEMTKTTNKYDSIVCPLCRDETAIPESGIEGLPTNFFIKNLLEVAELKSKNESLLCSNCEDGLKAMVRCIECDEFFCQKCLDAHNRLKTYQEHKVVDLKNLLSPTTSKEFHPAMKCADHDLACRFYCRTCNVLICRDCTVVDHPLATHSVANLKDVAEQCRERSLEAMGKAEKHIAHVKQVQHSCREKKEKLKTSVDTITAKLNEKKEHLIQQFIQTIEGRSSEMISQLEELMLDKVEQNERDEGQLESDLKRMGNYVLFMRNLLANGNDDEMMNMYDHLVRYVNDPDADHFEVVEERGKCIVYNI
ncbi:E3 ubiquitin- ligase TRIM71-like, partial [Paramuricea clavata]